MTIRVILTLAITYKWEIQQIDINNAFLNDNLQDEVYMTQPPSFVSKDKHLICKLTKALYGFQQAPRAWYEKLTQALIQLSFTSSKCDNSIFLYCEQGISLYVLVYVNDILITGSHTSLIHDLINKLHNKFALKRLGRPNYFMGIEVKSCSNSSLLLTQTKYVRDLLVRDKMVDANGVLTPMLSTCKRRKHDSSPLDDA